MKATAPAPTGTQGAPLPPLAQNLRKWRERRQLTVSALARSAKVSKSTVSELERGNGNPSLDTIWALASSLHVSLGALFAGIPTRGDSHVIRLADATVLTRENSGVVAQLLANWQSRGDVELAVVTLPADARRNSEGNALGVVERAVCAEGTVEVGTATYSAVLRVGDMMSFHADQPHYYQAIGNAGRLIVVQQYADRV